MVPSATQLMDGLRIECKKRATNGEDDDQNALDSLCVLGSSLSHARDAVLFLTSCALGTLSGSAWCNTLQLAAAIWGDLSGKIFFRAANYCPLPCPRTARLYLRTDALEIKRFGCLDSQDWRASQAISWCLLDYSLCAVAKRSATLFGNLWTSVLLGKKSDPLFWGSALCVATPSLYPLLRWVS